MFQPKKQQPSQISNVRLPKLPSNPGFDDIQYAVGQAQKSRGRTVELPWSAGHASFMLSLVVDPDGNEQTWTMHAGDGPDTRVLWTYPTGDLQLILNLILGESSGGQLQDKAHQAGAYVSAVKPPEERKEAQTANQGYSQPHSTPTWQLDPSLTDSTTRARAILSGDLANMQVPNLLQSVVLSKMTGRLGVVAEQGSSDLYFELGVPVHAQIGTTMGDLAIIELLMWDDGQFQFYPDERTSHRTVTKRLDSLLMEGVTLVDHNKFLLEHGVKSQSFLLRKQKNIAEAQFEQMVQKGSPVDLAVQKRFYQAIDNKSTLYDVLRKVPLPKTEWIPIMFNMISCDLVSVTDKAPLVTTERQSPLKSFGIDQAAIETVSKALQRSETGLFSFPAFLYFLDLEFNRFKSFGWPFSVAVLEMRYRPTGPQGQLETLPLAAIKEISNRISSITRKTDFFAHFETFDYVVLLSNTNTAAAAMFCNQTSEVIRSAPVPQTPDVRSISISMGVASLPEDCAEIGTLLSAAREAKNRAKERSVPLALFKDLSKQ
jgi:GGDEF domain-containing protein